MEQKVLEYLKEGAKTFLEIQMHLDVMAVVVSKLLKDLIKDGRIQYIDDFYGYRRVEDEYDLKI